VNWPKPEEIVLQWRPAPKQKVEEDSFVIQCVSQQTWTGLAIKDFGAEQGLAKKTLHLSCKGRRSNNVKCAFQQP